MIRSLALFLTAITLLFSFPTKNTAYAQDTLPSEMEWDEMMEKYRYEEYEELYFSCWIWGGGDSYPRESS